MWLQKDTESGHVLPALFGPDFISGKHCALQRSTITDMRRREFHWHLPRSLYPRFETVQHNNLCLAAASDVELIVCEKRATLLRPTLGRLKIRRASLHIRGQAEEIVFDRESGQIRPGSIWESFCISWCPLRFKTAISIHCSERRLRLAPRWI